MFHVIFLSSCGVYRPWRHHRCCDNCHSAVIDTHVHLDLLTDENALVDAVAVGVTRIIGIGVDPRRPSTPHVAVPPSLVIDHALGLHPQELKSENDVDDALQVLRARIAVEHVVAVGETGLDGRREMMPAALQEHAYRAQLRLRRDVGLPLLLHGVRRDERMLALFDEERRSSDPPTVWHGFSSSKDTMLAACKRGIAISIGFIALNENARRVKEAIPHIPDDMLLIETDAPPLEPKRIVDVVAAIAAMRDVTVQHIVDVTTRNADRLLPSRSHKT
jgi:TatD DNase family protein